MNNQKKMDKVLEQVKYLAVCKSTNKDEVVRIAQALMKKNIYAIELAYRGMEHFDAVDACISTVRSEVPQILVGAATITNENLACRALVAGAQFILSPGFSKKTVKFCIKNDLPIYPGVMTPSEVQAASNMGLTLLKFFPVECAGGVATLKAIGSPFPDVKFIVSGGVNSKNAETYMKASNVAVISGSYLCDDLFPKE